MRNLATWAAITAIATLSAVSLGGNWFLVLPCILWLAGVRIEHEHPRINDAELRAWLDA
jgi:CRISPR/Cas system-associated protein Cas7 (RAMP superfamily)